MTTVLENRTLILVREIEKFIIRQPPIGEKMIMIVKTPGSQMGSPAAAEGGGEVT